MQSEKEKNLNLNLRLIVIGSPFVGKTTFCEKLAIDCKWDLDLVYRLGYRLYKRDDVINRQLVKVEIRNTLGYERYRRRLLEDLEKCDGIVLIYDMTEEASFDEIKMWIDHLEQHQQGLPEARVLLGNKADLDDQREVTFEEGRKYAEKFQAIFLEVSAGKSDGIAHAYRLLLEKMIFESQEKYRRNKEEVNQNVVEKKEFFHCG